MTESVLAKILIAIFLFGVMQMVLFWSRMADMGDQKMTLEAEVEMLTRKKEQLTFKIIDLEREEHRMKLKIEKIDYQ